MDFATVFILGIFSTKKLGQVFCKNPSESLEFNILMTFHCGLFVYLRRDHVSHTYPC